MSMEQYPWDLEERIEDAFVAHLKTMVGRTAMIVPRIYGGKSKYPLIVVACGQTDNKNETAPFTGKRACVVTIRTTVEIINYNGDPGTEAFAETVREQYRAIKSQVVGALSGNDLHTILNDVGIQGVDFSMAHMTDQGEPEFDNTRLSFNQNVDVIAQPKEL